MCRSTFTHIHTRIHTRIHRYIHMRLRTPSVSPMVHFISHSPVNESLHPSLWLDSHYHRDRFSSFLRSCLLSSSSSSPSPSSRHHPHPATPLPLFTPDLPGNKPILIPFLLLFQFHFTLRFLFHWTNWAELVIE